MNCNRTIRRMVLGVWVLVFATPALAQVKDMQYFAPAQIDTFGGGRRANEGFFISGEYLRWSISKPDVTSIGDPGTRRVFAGFNANGDAILRDQRSTLDNSFIGAKFSDGSRVDLGYIEGHEGWLFSYTYLSTLGRTHGVASADIVFEDPEFGGASGYPIPVPGPAEGYRHLQGYVDDALTNIQNLPVTFTAPYIEDVEADEGGDPDSLPEPSWGVMMENLTEHWSTELNYIHRCHPTRHGTTWEFFFGVRYFELDEDFNVWAPYSYAPYDPTLEENDPNGVGFPTRVGILADSYWFTTAENHVVGPQIGAHFFRSYNRWTFDVQARFFAGFNFQNLKQHGVLGSRLNSMTPDATAIVGVPLFMGPTGFSHSESEEEWSPCAELRAGIKYQVTSKIALNVGWTGLWMDGIARASNVIEYRVPDMGISKAHNTEDLFLNGVTAGVEFNR